MSFHKLFDEFPREGELVWIGIRPARRAPLQIVAEARLDPAGGMLGDHYTGRHNRKRQITLIQDEHLAVVSALMGRPVTAASLRRNLVIRGINLLALNGLAIEIGEAQLKITGPCAPCSRMDEALGPGGFNAMRGHGGMTAEILTGGLILLGDTVKPVARDRIAPPRQGDLFPS